MVVWVVVVAVETSVRARGWYPYAEGGHCVCMFALSGWIAEIAAASRSASSAILAWSRPPASVQRVRGRSPRSPRSPRGGADARSHREGTRGGLLGKGSDSDGGGASLQDGNGMARGVSIGPVVAAVSSTHGTEEEC